MLCALFAVDIHMRTLIILLFLVRCVFVIMGYSNVTRFFLSLSPSLCRSQIALSSFVIMHTIRSIRWCCCVLTFIVCTLFFLSPSLSDFSVMFSSPLSPSPICRLVYIKILMFNFRPGIFNKTVLSLFSYFMCLTTLSDSMSKIFGCFFLFCSSSQFTGGMFYFHRFFFVFFLSLSFNRLIHAINQSKIETHTRNWRTQPAIESKHVVDCSVRVGLQYVFNRLSLIVVQILVFFPRFVCGINSYLPFPVFAVICFVF